jgi:exodeoxyribonuclease V alpha subunit
MQNSVLLRVTNVFPTFKNGRVYFSGVRVNKISHAKSSANDFYYVRTSENDMPMLPVAGQLWHITDAEIFVEKKPSPCGKYEHTHHTISQVQELTNVLPKTCQSFIEFIEKDNKFKGLGRESAKKIWNEFGTEIFDIMKRKDTVRLMTVLTEKSARALIAGYERYGNLRYAIWMSERAIPLAVQHRIFRFERAEHSYKTDMLGNTYSVNPIEIIERNPYLLVNFGLSFGDTDKIASNHFSVEKTDPRRLMSAITDALQQQTKRGHTIASPSKIKTKLKALLSEMQHVELALKLGHDSSAYIITSSGEYQYKPIYIQENVVAKRLLKLSKKPVVFDNDVNQACADTFAELLPDKLEPLQTEAVLTAVENSVSCITGGPGTGKTFVLNAVLAVYKKLGYTIKAMALSGKAALRMKQSIAMKTSTIAKFLLGEPITDVNKYLIVIDEASMIDLSSMYRLVTHTYPNVRFLLVGDPEQLPSIGSGNILADIVRSGVISNTKLEIVKRQAASSGIPEYAKNIVEGIVPPKLTTGSITFHNTGFDGVADKCIELFSQSPDESRIIAPTRLIVKTANEGCQHELNASAERLVYKNKQGWFTWDAADNLRKNDQVLFTKNNEDADVQNGSLGCLISVEQTSSEYVGLVKLSDDEKIINLTPTLLQSLELGYAITLHKAQGSQFPRCIIALSAISLVDRAWLYTALTRAEAEIHIVGPESKLKHAIKNVSNASLRQTNLVHLLQNNKKGVEG